MHNDVGQYFVGRSLLVTLADTNELLRQAVIPIVFAINIPRLEVRQQVSSLRGRQFVPASRKVRAYLLVTRSAGEATGCSRRPR